MEDIVVGQNISVKVEEFLSDLILVSFKHSAKYFQGILLDSTKRFIPCGILNTPQPGVPEEPILDKLYSVSQRYSYCQYNDNSFKNVMPISYKKSNGSKLKSSRMTIRLRPRQVLCSNCQSICSENLDKVCSNNNNINDHSTEKNILQSKIINNNNNKKNNSRVKESRSSRETRQSVNIKVNKNKTNNQVPHTSGSQVLVPKLVKLKASDIENAMCNTVQNRPTLELTQSNENEDTFDNNKRSNIKSTLLLTSMKKRSKFSKELMSTSKLLNEEIIDHSIKTRSRGSIDENIDININLMSVNPFGSCAERDIDSQKNIDLRQTESSHNNCQTMATQSSIIPDEESINHGLPKVAILSINSKPSENSDFHKKLDKLEKVKLLRKKRTVEILKDSWEDDNEGKKAKLHNRDATSTITAEDDGTTDSDKPKHTPVLKISFGPGKGTVLKIPAKSTVSENDCSETEDKAGSIKANSNIITKAYRKALKKAKKDAQKKALIGSAVAAVIVNKSRLGRSPIRLGGLSPARLSGRAQGILGNSSPGLFGNVSPGRFSGASPCRFGSSSPGKFSCTSPGRFGGASPARFGGASPARFGGHSSVFSGMMSPRGNIEGFLSTQSRKHKHKVKHKKKHKEERKHKSDENIEPNSLSHELFVNKEENKLLNVTNMDIPTDKASDDIKKGSASPDQILSNSSSHTSSPNQNILQTPRHKLSISIKRVSNASYITCDPCVSVAEENEVDASVHLSEKLNATFSNTDESRSNLSTENLVTLTIKSSYAENDFNYLNISSATDFTSDLNESSNETCAIPNFPWISSTNSEEHSMHYQKHAWHDIDSYESGGNLFSIGDIVWGKIEDFPWWPSKIISLKESNESSKSYQSQVRWYGTSSSSLLPMQSLQPFLKKYESTYIKEIEGPYQDAVREANFDAFQILREAENAHNLCESPITSSPREVNVIS